MTTLTRDQRVRRGALIDEAYRRNPVAGYLAAIQEGAQRFREGTRPGRGAGRAPAIAPAVLAEAVAVALARQKAARKARKATAARAATEAAAARILRERKQLAAQFSEAAIGKSLRESTADDLAAIAATALSGTGQPASAGRPVIEMTVDPGSLDLGELGLAASVGMAGDSPFMCGSNSTGNTPFMRGLQPGGASKGTADA